MTNNPTSMQPMTANDPYAQNEPAGQYTTMQDIKIPEAQFSGSLSLDNLPQAVKDVLPEGAQRIFIAAYNSIYDNSHDEGTAAQVAWQTINHNNNYVQEQDGKWHLVTDLGGMHNPTTMAAS